MSETGKLSGSTQSSILVPKGTDRFGTHRSLGISTITFKVSSRENTGIFVIENTFHQKGGPARHLHYDQDEWFFPVEGNFTMEIGQHRFELQPGDSILGPRNVPHVWAYAGDAIGRMLIVFSPAGKMEAFFEEVTQGNSMPQQDPQLWRAHGMELLGPPLIV